jgi:3-hydroxybutyryl-CoA dehydrogenase
VSIVEPKRGAHDNIVAEISRNLACLNKANSVDRLDMAERLEELDWAHINLMVECVPENLEIKRDLFRRLDTIADESTVLASNSSSFPISAIADGCATAVRMLGLHFFMPAHIVPLVEVVQASSASDHAAEALAAFMRRCGSVPIRVRKDIPGFVANRMQHALAREAFSLIQDGIASPRDVDAAVRFGFGFRYLAAGPVLQKEHAGLDVHASAAATIYPSLSNIAMPPAVLADKKTEGKLGFKSGQGFYSWDAASIEAEKLRYNRLLRAGLVLLSEELPSIDP